MTLQDRRMIVAAAVAAVASLQLVPAVRAIDVNWVSNGADQTLWSDGTHWSGGAAPNGASYNVTIKKNNNPAFFSSIQLDQNVTIGNLTLINRAAVDPSPSGAPFNLTVTGTTAQVTEPGFEGAYGILHVPNGATWNIGHLANIDGSGVLTGGYIIEDNATLVASNATNLRSLNSFFNLDGPNARFINGSGQNALANLQNINPGGGVTFNQNVTVTPDAQPTGGNFTNNGTVNVQGGVQVSIQGVYTASGFTILSNPGSSPAILNGTGMYFTGSHILSGNGTLMADTFSNAAFISPGFSPGSLTFDGQVTLEAESVLQIEIGGTTAGTEYDTVIVSETGALTLGGLLQLSLIDGFVPDTNDTFTIVTLLNEEESILGTFENVQSGDVLYTAGNEGYFTVSYDDGFNVTLSNYTAVPEPGALSLLAGAMMMAYRRRRVV